MADNFFKNRNGIALGSLAAAPSNPLNGDFYYDTTLSKFRRYENGAWGSFGSGAGGGSKNYLTAYTASTASGVPNTGNGDLEGGSTAGFGLGAVTLTSNFPSGVPTFGSGASGNLSLSLISSAQLAALYSLGYISSAATTAGNFVATDAFFIDKEDQARVLAFKFAYNAFANGANGNFSGSSSNSFGVAIWDVTNAAWIQPAGVFNLVQNSGTGLCTGTFQTTSNSTQYRLVIYNANATAGAISMYFDDFSVGPQITATGADVGDWIAYTPVFQGLGTVTSNSAWYRRVGDSVEVWGRVTAGTTTAVPFSVGLPTGMIADGTKYVSTQTIMGEMQSLSGAAAWNQSAGAVGWLFANTSNAVNMNFAVATTTSALTPANGNTIISSGQSFAYKFTVPITGWSSNTIMSNDTDTRVVTLSVQGSTTALASVANTQIVNPTVINDTHGGYNASTGVYTVPVSGYYDVYGYIGAAGSAGSANQAFIALLFKNGSQVFSGPSFVWNSSVSLNPSAGISGTIQCNAGDTLALNGRNTTGSSISLAGGTNSTLMITRRSGPATIAATETVAAHYHGSTATLPQIGSIVAFALATKDFDSHSAYNTSTGLFTCPVSGKYRVSAHIHSSSSAAAVSNVLDMRIYKSGVQQSQVLKPAYTTTAVEHGILITDTVSCLAGDTIAIFAAQNLNGTTLAVANDTSTFFAIERIGN